MCKSYKQLCVLFPIEFLPVLCLSRISTDPGSGNQSSGNRNTFKDFVKLGNDRRSSYEVEYEDSDADMAMDNFSDTEIKIEDDSFDEDSVQDSEVSSKLVIKDVISLSKQNCSPSYSGSSNQSSHAIGKF